MARIFGWAVRGRGDEVDHTYVTCDNGRKWECFGQCEGGMLICEGTVSPKAVEGIASQAHAGGIEYAVTGISHQAANRLLWGSKGMVSEARGFWACAMLFGVYGSDALDWLRSAGRSLQQSESPQGPSRAILKNAPHMRALVTSIQERYMRAIRVDGAQDAEGLLGDEFSLMIEGKLGQSYSRQRAAHLLSRHRQLMREKRSLDAKLEIGSLDKPAYMRDLDIALNSALLDMACDIGVRDFISLFEIDPSRPLRLARAKKAGAGRKGRRPRYNKPNGAKAAARKGSDT